MARSVISTLLVATVILVTFSSLVSSSGIFKPHPSLPSLESLGVTPVQLYDMAINQTNNAIHARDEELRPRSTAYTDHCDGRLCAPAGVTAAAACAQYFKLIPDAPFTVDRTFQVLCQAGPYDDEPQALVIGYAIITDDLHGAEPSATSIAKDVADGVYWVMNNCPNDSCNIAGKCGISGTAAATGNGEFLVYVASEVGVEGRC